MNEPCTLDPAEEVEEPASGTRKRGRPKNPKPQAVGPVLTEAQCRAADNWLVADLERQLRVEADARQAQQMNQRLHLTALVLVLNRWQWLGRHLWNGAGLSRAEIQAKLHQLLIDTEEVLS